MIPWSLKNGAKAEHIKLQWRTSREAVSVNKERQLRTFVRKQKQLISEAPAQEERDYIAMMWLGYLNGMRLTNAINCQEYNSLYDEVKQFCEYLGVA